MIEYKGYRIDFNSKYNCYYIYWKGLSNRIDYRFDSIDDAKAFIDKGDVRYCSEHECLEMK